MKLNKCLCGGNPQIIRDFEHFDSLGKVIKYVACPQCEAMTNFYDNIEEAIKEWNKEN